MSANAITVSHSTPSQQNNTNLPQVHRGRIAALVSAGADLLAIETIPSYAETQALIELLEQEFTDAEVWITFTLRDASHISDGTPLTTVIALLEESKQVVALGVNCVPESDVLAAVKVLRGLTSKALVVYPNSGEVWNAESRSWSGERKEGEGLAERVKEWYAAGARLIGGCCRTTPADISTIEQALKDVNR
jgi:homocysteine S-methyltransferase